jgi:integrase/recombinase XerC
LKAAIDPGERADEAVPVPASVDRYLDFLLVQRKLSLHTIDAYRRDLAALAAFIAKDARGDSIETLKAPQVRRFAASLHARGLAPRSIARALSSWRGYYVWLALYEDGPTNPVVDVRAPKLGKRLPKALSEEWTRRLLDHQARDGEASTDADAAARTRDLAVFELFYSSGLRLSELVDLDVAYAKDALHVSRGWIDLESAEVTVTGKGNKRRTVPIGTQARRALVAWLALRPGFVRADPHPLFLSARGARLSGRTIQSRLKARAQAAGVPAHVHPHVLRHSFASHLLQGSGDLRAVQELLGHASIAATQVYTAVDFKRLADVYDQAHPRARRK